MNPPTDSLTDKVAVVTGAASGLGAAVARLLAACGAKVALIDRDESALQEVAGEIENTGGGALALSCDVTSAEGLASAVQKINESWDRLDIVVANAGINGVWAPIDEITPEEWDRTMDINLKGAFLTVRSCVPLLKQGGGGSVILMSSLMGNRMFSTSGATAYSTSKAAIVSFGRMIALELAKNSIRVNTVCPGAFKTNIMQNTESRHREGLRLPVKFPEGKWPLGGGKRGKPEQVARLVWFLSSDLSDYITGTEVYIDGGQSLLMG
jgi:NAD(P)-dependent dehydrogenase (short-subunit alcohol dehydrogenase family)